MKNLFLGLNTYLRFWHLGDSVQYINMVLSPMAYREFTNTNKYLVTIYFQQYKLIKIRSTLEIVHLLYG